MEAAQAEALRALVAGAPAPVRLGILGGTFDPVHNAHLALARQAREALGLAAVVLIPTGRPAFKQDREVTDGAVRLRLCEAAVAGEEGLAVSSVEVDRPGITYAADTLRELAEALPGVELVFILGADSALTLPRWREAEALARLATFAVANRPGYEMGPAEQATLREAGFRLETFPMPALDVSSSALRERVASGDTLAGAVPAAVQDIIEAEGLYKKEADHG